LVGEYGVWNGAYGGRPQSRDNAAAQWCDPAGNYLVAAVKAKRLAGVHSWMILWGDGVDGHGNSWLDPKNVGAGGDWWDVVSGPWPNYLLNPWGKLAVRDCQAIASLRG
jgi:hypothetical protein